MGTSDLKGKTVAELREEAKALGIGGISSMKKDELIDTIESHAKGGAITSAGTPEPKRDKKTPTKKSELKKRIRELKTQKVQALSEQDKARAKSCNREIHNLKRLLRKMARMK